MVKILDCTLRDGGYYTNWDFSTETVNAYIHAMNVLPVDYLELGYRNKPSKEYIGKFGYCPVSVLKNIRKNSKKKLCVMLNEKNTHVNDLPLLLQPISGLVDMIRIAIDPQNFDRAVVLAKAIKAMGYEVGFNVMYMSKWQTDYPEIFSKLNILNSFTDLFCMVDSFGGVTPDDVTFIYKRVRENLKCPIGFHGHNNLQLGLINTITAIRLGVDFVDATILGMGRGAGNLNIELLLTFLNTKEKLQVDFNTLSDVITAFTPLYEHYQWGTNLPYMLAGSNSIPQKEVMDWVSNRVYSFNSIVRALENRKNNAIDNAKFPHINVRNKFDKVIVIGGGNYAIEHNDAIKDFIAKEKNVAVIFATARNANVYKDIKTPIFYILAGNEGKRLAVNVGGNSFKGTCVLPPYPRPMGTEVPDFAKDYTVELESIDFTSQFKDSVTAIALQLAIYLTEGKIFVVGYDGYPGNVLSEKEVALTNENKTIFQAFKETKGEKLKSLTPSLYKELEIESVYQYL